MHAHNGHRIGTLCVIDQRPRSLGEHQVDALRTLARQVESELELRRLNAELVAIDAGRERFNQYLAHDLSSPVTSINLIAAELREDADSADARVFGAQVGEAAKALEAMIDDLRLITLGRSGVLAPRWESFDARAVLRRAHEVSAARFSSLAFALELPSAPVHLEADPCLVQRVLHNLLVNASEHASAEVRASVLADGADWVEFVVEDDGRGVSPEVASHLFEPYQRGARRNEDQSRGLGLSFSRAAIEAHGGRITLDSPAGGGTRFEVRLPARGAPVPVDS